MLGEQIVGVVRDLMYERRPAHNRHVTYINAMSRYTCPRQAAAL